jgi:hypothetical protein
MHAPMVSSLHRHAGPAHIFRCAVNFCAFRSRTFLARTGHMCIDTGTVVVELERVSSKTMYTWVVQKKLPARTRNLTYPWQTRHARQLVNDGFMGAGGIANTTRPRGPKYTWAAILGFRSLAAEKDIPNLSISCALDFSHLGVYPDEIKEWHEGNCRVLGVKAAAELKAAWLRIEGLLILRPNVMQGLIKEKLDGYEKLLLEQYPKTEAEQKTEIEKRQRKWQIRSLKPQWCLAEEARVAAETGEFDAAAAAEAEREAAAKLQKKRQYACKELLCKLARRREHEAGVKRQTEKRVISKLAKCEACNELFRTTHLASGVELAMLNDPTLVDSLAKALNNTTVVRRNDAVRDWILAICYPGGDRVGSNLGSNGQRWPARPGPSGYSSVTKRVIRVSIHRLARTLALDIGVVSDRSGVDGTLTENQALLETNDSIAVCKGTCMQLDHPEEVEALPECYDAITEKGNRLCLECWRPIIWYAAAGSNGKCVCCGLRILSFDVRGQPCSRCKWRSRLCRTSTAERIQKIRNGIAELANTPIGTLDKKDVATQEAFTMMLATQETMDPAISRFGGTSSPRRAQVLLKARRERAAETGQRGLPQRVAQSGSGDESSDDGGCGGGGLDLGSSTQGGDGGGGNKNVTGKRRGRKGGINRRREKKRRLKKDDDTEHP